MLMLRRGNNITLNGSFKKVPSRFDRRKVFETGSEVMNKICNIFGKITVVQK